MKKNLQESELKIEAEKLNEKRIFFLRRERGKS